MRRDEIDGSSKNMKKMIIGSALIAIICGCTSPKDYYIHDGVIYINEQYKYELSPNRNTDMIVGDDYATQHRNPEVINMMRPPFMDAIQ